MLEADGNLILLVMVVVAMIATLLYDLFTNVREPQPQREKSAPSALARDEQPAAEGVTVVPWVFGLDLATLRTPPVATRLALTRMQAEEEGAKQTDATDAVADLDPIVELRRRLAALRQLGMDHVREAHPLFQGSTPLAASVAPSTTGTTDSRTGGRQKSRRGTRRALPAGLAAAHLRLAAHRGRVLPVG